MIALNINSCFNIGTSEILISLIKSANADPENQPAEVTRKKFIPKCEVEVVAMGLTVIKKSCIYCAWTCDNDPNQTVSNCAAEKSCEETLELF